MNLDELKKEAKSKKTSAARLEELARHSDTSIQLAVANNPNANAATLEYLSGHGMWNILKAVAKNPSMPSSAQIRLARHKQVSVREMLVQRSDLAPETLEALARDTEVNLVDLVMHYNAHLRSLPQVLEAFVTSPVASARRGAARFAPVTSDQFERLFKDSDPHIVGNLYFSPYSSPEQRQRVRNHQNPEVRCMIVKRGGFEFSVAELEKASRDSSPIVRAALAGQKPLMPHLLNKLSHDPDPEVRSVIVARFISAWDADLDSFSEELHPWVRAEVAWQTHNEALSFFLIEDSDLRVRLCLACNPKVPQDVLKELTKDDSPNVFELFGAGKSSPSSFTVAQRAELSIQQRLNAQPQEILPQPRLESMFDELTNIKETK
jgi:hypothetical protein